MGAQGRLVLHWEGRWNILSQDLPGMECEKGWVQGRRGLKDECKILSLENWEFVPLTDEGNRRESLFLFLPGNSHPLLGKFSNWVLVCFMSLCGFGVAIKWKEIMNASIPDWWIFSAEEKLVMKHVYSTAGILYIRNFQSIPPLQPTIRSIYSFNM